MYFNSTTVLLSRQAGLNATQYDVRTETACRVRKYRTRLLAM